MSPKIRYHDLRTSASSEDDFSLPHSTNSPLFDHGDEKVQSTRSRKAILAIAALAALTLYTATILSLPRALSSLRAHFHPFNHTDPAHGSCRSSPSEAESLGCIFDLMYWGWIHPNCYNASASSSWEAEYGPWVWKKHGPHADPLLNEDVPYEELRYHEAIFATDHYHWAHCLYSFEMVHVAALTDGGMVSVEVGPLSHTRRCVQRIKEYDTRRPDVYQTDVRNYYSTCYKLRE